MTSIDPRTLVPTNGIHGSTGLPLVRGATVDEIAAFVRGRAPSASEMADFKRLQKLREQDHLDVRFGVDPRDLAESGWGVIFPEGRETELRAPLAPLLAWRREQASRERESRYRELSYRRGDSKSRFLARYGLGPGPVDPDLLPYYLLIVADPEAISFRFQCQLDVQYAVGRLDLVDAESLALYAESVVAAEREQVRRERMAVFFGPSHPGDLATETSARQLLAPLSDHVSQRSADWAVETIRGTHATKAALAERLGGDRTPAFLFTASHGIGFDLGDPEQRERQGALLCQDWSGSAPLGPEHYFSAADVEEAASVAGLVAFVFACYGAGTPNHDSFAGVEPALEIAAQSFVARLPQRLLGHPNGGALAVIGHVDRAWTYSFQWANERAQLAVFESALDALIDGLPVGAAMEYFGQRYAEVSTELNDLLDQERWGRLADSWDVASLGVALHDARLYVVLGDPAARLAVSPIERAVLGK